MGKTCVICGKPSGMYPLCREHLQMKNEGFIVKCEDCGQWHFVDSLCPCQKSATYTELPTEGFETCVSCGAKTNGYAFCRKCFKKYSNDEMLDILNNQSNYDKRAKSFIVVDYDDIGEEENDEVSIYSEEYEPSNEDELTCIICGKPSNGKHFCRSCYFTYKERSIDIRITNCNSVQILDEFGSKTKKAKDGRYVRSLSEKIIIDYFFDNYIRVVYEKTIPYISKKGEHKELHPDFYLTDYNLYIEFNGLTSKEYLKKKEYANKIYKEKGLNVEILESDDINDIEATMGKLLDKYKKI